MAEVPSQRLERSQRSDVFGDKLADAQARRPEGGARRARRAGAGALAAQPGGAPSPLPAPHLGCDRFGAGRPDVGGTRRTSRGGLGGGMGGMGGKGGGRGRRAAPTPPRSAPPIIALRLAAALREDVMMDLGLVRSYVEDLAVDIQSLRRIMDYLISVTEEANDYRLLAVSALAVLIDRDLAMMDDRRDEIERLLLRQCV